MELQIGDRLTDETGEDEIIGRPYTTNAEKSPSFGGGARNPAHQREAGKLKEAESWSV